MRTPEQIEYAAMLDRAIAEAGELGERIALYSRLLALNDAIRVCWDEPDGEDAAWAVEKLMGDYADVFGVLVSQPLDGPAPEVKP